MRANRSGLPRGLRPQPLQTSCLHCSLLYQPPPSHSAVPALLTVIFKPQATHLEGMCCGKQQVTNVQWLHNTRAQPLASGLFGMREFSALKDYSQGRGRGARARLPPPPAACAPSCLARPGTRKPPGAIARPAGANARLLGPPFHGSTPCYAATLLRLPTAIQGSGDSKVLFHARLVAGCVRRKQAAARAASRQLAPCSSTTEAFCPQSKRQQSSINGNVGRRGPCCQLPGAAGSHARRPASRQSRAAREQQTAANDRPNGAHRR